MVGEPLQQHVGVPDLAEQVGQPLEVGAEAVGPLLVEQLGEGPQRGADPAGGHPGLVHRLRVLAGADPGLVPEQPQGAAGQVVAEQLLDRGVGVDRRLDDLVAEGPLAAAEGPQVLGGGLGRLGAGLEQPVDHLVEQADGRPRGPARPRARGSGPGCGGRPAPGPRRRPPRPAATPAASLSSTGRRRVRMRTDGDSWAVRTNGRIEGARLGRWPGPVAGEGVLGPDQQRAVLALGQLDRPALAGAVAQARSPAGQAQVGGVVVGGPEAPGGLGLGREAVVGPAELRQVEAGRGVQLRLALLHRPFLLACSRRQRGSGSCSAGSVASGSR